MKLRLLALAVIFASATSAQEWTSEKTKSAFYFTAGLNYAGTLGWDDPSEAGAGYFAGFNAGMGFTGVVNKRNTTLLTIEANFSQQGFRNTLAEDNADPDKLILNYVNVPLILRHAPFKGFRQMYVGIGPQVGFKVGGHIKTKGGDKMELNEEMISKTVFSGVGVVGFNFGHALNLGLEFGYQYSFTKLLEHSPELRHSVFHAKLILPVDFVAMLGGSMSN
jgi:hypothetical protein